MAQLKKHLIWLDCDPGHDDAMAIFMAAVHPDLDLLGISTVHGNQTVEKTTLNALKLLKFAGIKGIDIYKGLARPLVRPLSVAETIHGVSGLDGCELPETDQQPITEDTSKEQNRQLNFISTGCLSNLATLLTVYPDIREYINQISIMGGAIGIGNWSPAAEFNIWCDPEAAQIILHSGIKLTMVPIEVTHMVSVTPEILKEIEGYNNNFGKNVVGFLNFFHKTYIEVFDLDLTPLHDPCAVFYITNPEAFTIKHLNVEIETKSDQSDGRTNCDLYGVTKKPKNCHVAVNVDVPAFWKIMMSCLKVCSDNSFKV